MVEQKRRLTIDIGGGDGEFFRELAEQSPNKNYLVVDPTSQKKDDGFDNLWSVRWAMDENSGLPLSPESVNEAYPMKVEAQWGEMKL